MGDSVGRILSVSYNVLQAVGLFNLSCNQGTLRMGPIFLLYILASCVEGLT
jgi:hypothetical protein